MNTVTETVEEIMKRILEGIQSCPGESSQAVAQRNVDAMRRDVVERLYKLAQTGVPNRHKVLVPSVKGTKEEWHRKLNAVEHMIAGSSAIVALIGSRGNGKTQMAVELVKGAIQSNRTAIFTSAINFFMEIKQTYRKDSTMDEVFVMKKFSTPWMLVIDEVGKRGGSEWENNLLFELINRRYNERRTTVMIDNRSKAEFIEWIGPSLADRMNDGGGIVECNWPSFRGEQEEGR